MLVNSQTSSVIQVSHTMKEILALSIILININCFFSHNHLKVSKEVTPNIKQCLDNVYKRLEIDTHSIEAYIYPDSMVQAECLSSGHDDCIIRFSSTLIELLEPKEIEFVAGHEIGHFLLNHSGCHQSPTTTQSLDYYINKRAQEISADRLGFVACNSLETSLKALIKTISGLSSKHLRFDISAFIDQIRKTKDIKETLHPGENKSTHPSIMLRSRALLWFSLIYDEKRKKCTAEDVKNIDDKVKNDMDYFEDKSARLLIEEAKNNVKFWLLVQKVLSKNSFKKSDQNLIEQSFGADKLNSLINMLNGLSKNDVDGEIQIKIEQARQEFYNLVPVSFKKEMDDVSEYINKYN